MKIALIGYGAMGQLVGKLAVDQGHQIALTLDLDAADRSVEDLAAALRACEVAIDFSIADAVPKNVESCGPAGVPMVVGATGWQSHLERARRVVEQYNAALIHAANFSIGLQLFYPIASRAADQFSYVGTYH